MQRSPLLERHRADGARLASRPEAPDNLAVVTYGDVPAEYQAGRAGALLIDASDRGRVVVEGPDAANFLHRVLANDARALRPKEAQRGLLLTPKGKVRFAFDCLRESPERFLLATPPAAAAGLLQALDVYFFNEDLTLRDASDEVAPLELSGPETHHVARRVLGKITTPSALAWSHASLDDVPLRLLGTRIAGGLGLRLDAGPAGIERLWCALRDAGATAGGLAARDSLRIEAGAPLFGVDVDDNVYPQEARLDDAFSLEKGCYVGQEVVAKIDTYGGINKHLVKLRMDHDEPVPRGTRLLHKNDGEERDLGLITSWAYSFEHDAGLALGYVKRRHEEPGTRFHLDGDRGAAQVIA